MLAILGLLLIGFWILGLVLKITGAFIHLALLVGAALLIFHFLKSKKT